MADSLGFVGTMTVNSYMSPNEKGFGLHFDNQHVFLVQIEGAKKWKFFPQPAVTNPLDNYGWDTKEQLLKKFGKKALTPNKNVFLNTTLQPGDVLYLPPGTWHQGKSDNYSLGITLTLKSVSFYELFENILKKKLFEFEKWKQGVPLLNKNSFKNFEASQDIHRTFDGFKSDLLSHIKSIELSELTKEWIKSTPKDKLFYQNSKNNNSKIKINKNDVLEYTAPFRLKFFMTPHQLHLFYHEFEGTLPIEAFPLVKKLSKKSIFLANEVLKWSSISWRDASILLEKLISSGVLKISKKN